MTKQDELSIDPTDGITDFEESPIKENDKVMEA